MPTFSYQQILAIVQGYTGSLLERYTQWESEHDGVPPPPSFLPTWVIDEGSLAYYILINLSGE